MSCIKIDKIGKIAVGKIVTFVRDVYSLDFALN
jgi:hypothetical protein